MAIEERTFRIVKWPDRHWWRGFRYEIQEIVRDKSYPIRYAMTRFGIRRALNRLLKEHELRAVERNYVLLNQSTYVLRARDE